VRTLLLDIETSPNVADVWDLYKPTVGINQIRESSRVICFAAKWLHQPKTGFWSEWKDGHDAMVRRAHDLLGEADAVVHYNGESFDIPHLNREFLLARLAPPAPFQQVDLLKVVRANFKFPSNKLAYVSAALGYEGKIEHEGHALWTKVLAGDAKAQRAMRKYNIRDVDCLEELYDHLLPWIPSPPSHAVNGAEGNVCPFCGSAQHQRRGYAYTAQGRYQRFQCQACSGWFRGVRREDGAEVRPVAL